MKQLASSNCAVNVVWWLVKEACSECEVVSGQGSMQ